MTVTLRDVAARAGVSFKTVSNVVNGHPHVSEVTRARVLAAIELLGYRPNQTARSLRHGRSGILALAVPELTSPYFAALASAAGRAAKEHGRVLVIDAGGSMRRAVLGDLLAKKAVDNGWSGIVVYGCIRDSAAIADMSIGVKALGTHPLKTDKRGEGQRDIPVRFGGVTFRPGDWLYADEDGVIVARRALIQ